MARLTITPGVQNLLAHWGSIQSAASQRLGVSGAWDALRTALNLGATTSVSGIATLQDMNAVYGLAAANRNASELLNAATDDEVLTAAMIGSTPNARAAAVSEAAPLYNVRVQYTYTQTGETVADWLTVQIPQSLTGFTAGALKDLVTTLSTGVVTSYGLSTVTLTAFEISAA